MRSPTKSSQLSDTLPHLYQIVSFWALSFLFEAEAFTYTLFVMVEFFTTDNTFIPANSHIKCAVGQSSSSTKQMCYQSQDP